MYLNSVTAIYSLMVILTLEGDLQGNMFFTKRTIIYS